MQAIIRHRDLILPVSIIGCLLVILVPLPTPILDLLLAGNIAIALLVLLTTIHVASPLEFSVFPTLLLATTLARLVLNVATTRLILTGADRAGANAAGNMIESFGTFVAGDQLEVGVIIFVILIVIQFVVITKGASRISEVAARFALDGMPGRQMAIDSDLNAGVIDEETARRRREEISEQADFYGTMDGASKFVRGDAIAAIIITIVNILGGLYVGVVHLGMPLGLAATTFTKLTIGDGLVSQIPALLISIAAGFLVTRSSKHSDLPVQFLQQLLSNTKALSVAGGFLLLLILTNLPVVPVAILGSGCVGLALVLSRQKQRVTEEERARLSAVEEQKHASKASRIEDFLAIDPMEISIGVGLLDLADPTRGGDLMERITSVRQAIAADLGIILPKVRVRDDPLLGDDEYVIRIHGNVVCKNHLRTHAVMAIETGIVTGDLKGEIYRLSDGTPAGVWVDVDQSEQAAIFGYKVQKPIEVLVSELEQTAKTHADELLSRDATKHLLDEVRSASPMVVDELLPDLMKVSEVQNVLHLLLREDVPIRQMELILEVLGDASSYTKDPERLVEQVRQRLSRTISSRYRDESGTIHVLTLDPAIEMQLAQGMDSSGFGTTINWSPAKVEQLSALIRETILRDFPAGQKPVLLVAPKIRLCLHRMITSSLPHLRVLSFGEISDQTRVESHGLVSQEVLAAAG